MCNRAIYWISACNLLVGVVDFWVNNNSFALLNLAFSFVVLFFVQSD